MTRKMSDTKVAALLSVAAQWPVSSSTVRANTWNALTATDAYVVRSGDRAQLTDAGWLALINHSAETAQAVLDLMVTAHVEALEVHADHQRTVLAHQRSMLAAPADAQWYGARNSTVAMTDFDAAMAHVQYGPWWGHTAAREGILAAIADEVNASDDQYCIERLGKIGAAFLADPNRLVVAVDGLQFAIWTNGRSPLSEIDLAHTEALDMETARSYRTPDGDALCTGELGFTHDREEAESQAYDERITRAMLGGGRFSENDGEHVTCLLCGADVVLDTVCGECGASRIFLATPEELAAERTDESPRFNQRVDGVNIPSATQVARNELIDQQAAATRLGVPEETQRAYEASQVAATATEWPTSVLTPMTSVAHVTGITGRVLRHDTTTNTVTVYWHGSHGVAAHHGDVARNTLRTVADLWESIEDTAKSQLGLHEPALFYVSDWWPGLDDADVRSLDWRHTVHDERIWGRAIVMTHPELFHSDGSGEEYVRFVMLASYGDYSGSTVDAANHRYFTAAYVTGRSDPLAYEVGYNERDGVGIAVRIGDPRFDIAALSELDSEVTGLADYPSVDDMALSDYESSLQDEWWSNHGLWDLKTAVDNHFEALSVVDSNGNPYTWETAVLASDLPYTVVDDNRDDLLETVFFSGDTDIEWVYDNATSAHPNDVDDATEYVIGVVFAAEQPNHYGPVTTADGDVWLTADQIAAHAVSASPLAQLVMSFAGLGCERCGRPDLMPLDNGTYPRHTDPMTRTRCHASGTKISQESE